MIVNGELIEEPIVLSLDKDTIIVALSEHSELLPEGIEFYHEIGDIITQKLVDLLYENINALLCDAQDDIALSFWEAWADVMSWATARTLIETDRKSG